MGPKVDYEKDNVERENESSANVVYDVHDNQQRYHKKNCSKGVEKHCVTKYKTGRGRSASHSSAAGRTVSSRQRSPAQSKSAASGANCSRSSSGGGGGGVVAKSRRSGSKRSGSGSGGGGAKSGRRRASSASKPKSRVEVSAKCYDVRRGRRRQPCRRAPAWQNGKYVRDECGSGMVPRRYDFKPSRKLWCKTPLSMYQATIGELARKILCREKVVARDVKPAPPCNIEEYILPPCRGYYRKYDCLRPCEEEYAFYKGGQKQYRDRVQRYWEPCYTQEEKYKLDVNEYAPQNAFLAAKLRRYNMRAGDTEPPCW